MPSLDIQINGKAYQVACDAGQERRLLELAHEIDQRARGLGGKLGQQVQEPLLLVMTALTLADDLLDASDEILRLRSELEHIAGGLTPEERQAELEAMSAEIAETVAARVERLAERLAAKK